MLPFISSWLFIGPHLLSTKTSRIINSMLAVYFIVPEMFFPVWAFIRGISQMGQYSKYFCMIADRMRLELNYLLTYSLKFYNHDPPLTFQAHFEIKMHFYFAKPQYYSYVWSSHGTNNGGGAWPWPLTPKVKGHNRSHSLCSPSFLFLICSSLSFSIISFSMRCCSCILSFCCSSNSCCFCIKTNCFKNRKWEMHIYSESLWGHALLTLVVFAYGPTLL